MTTPTFSAVIAVCELVDVVPIVERFLPYNGGMYVTIEEGRGPIGLWYTDSDPNVSSLGQVKEYSDQLPYGDFTPGRFAWILKNIQPIEPIPIKGHQGLWNWENSSKQTAPDKEHMLLRTSA